MVDLKRLGILAIAILVVGAGAGACTGGADTTGAVEQQQPATPSGFHFAIDSAGEGNVESVTFWIFDETGMLQGSSCVGSRAARSHSKPPAALLAAHSAFYVGASSSNQPCHADPPAGAAPQPDPTDQITYTDQCWRSEFLASNPVDLGYRRDFATADVPLCTS